MATPATIARPYARAAFAIASEESAVDQWSRMLSLGAAIATMPAMAAAIADPSSDRATVVAVMDESAAGAFNGHARTFLRLLADNRRLPLLPWIARHYEDLRAQAEGRAQARVAAARPISAEEAARLKTNLEAALGRTVQLDLTVDESLLAGAVIRIGDRVIDGSAAGRVRCLAQHLG